MTTYDCDVAIVGAGPAGCACALSLANSELRVALIDKSTFPRDKICGDALSPDVLKQLSTLNGDLRSSFETRNGTRKQDVVGVKLVASNGKIAELSITGRNHKLNGWVVKRMDFDNFLFEEASALDNVRVFQGQKVRGASVNKTGVELDLAERTIKAQIVIGADGAHSVIAKFLAPALLDRNHYCGGIRAYYKNVDGMHPDGMIELHFYKQLLPGYFWIFPLPNGEVNVGLGMLSSHISKHKINLRKSLAELLESEATLKERFRDAAMIDDMKGFGLPLGSKKRQMSGERFLLLGDAAGLIDPVTGEGVGNAIRSGRVAAEQITTCFNRQDFSVEQMRGYDKRIHQLLWSEMKFSRMLQLAFKYPFVTNFFTGLAARSKRFSAFLSNIVTDPKFWGDGFNIRRWIRHARNTKKTEQ